MITERTFIKRYTLFVLFLFLSTSIYAQDFKLQNGDLIFQEACASDLGNSIKLVTNSIDSYEFTHVGIVYIDDKDSVHVLEATHPKTVLTPISEYLYKKDEKGCHPKSVVGRLKDKYQPLITKALAEGFLLLGKDYDYGFVLGNDMYYCSELIYEIFKRANQGEDVFPLNIMTFKSQDSEEISPGWIEYFSKHGLSLIPEGEYGINPGAMSRSDVISIVHYFDK